MQAPLGRRGAHSSHCLSAPVPVSSSSRMGVSVPSKERLSTHHGYATAYCMRHPPHLPPLSPSPRVLVDRGGVGGRREAFAATGDSPFLLSLLPCFLSGRSTAASHYTPRLHLESNHTILIPRVIEFKVHLDIPLYPITT